MLGKTLLVTALILLPAAPAAGQVLIDALNDQPAGYNNGSMSGVIFAVQHQLPKPGIISAVEFWCGHSKSATGSVYIYAHDSVGNQPGQELGKGSFTAPAAKAWAGAVLNKVVPMIQPNQVFWVGFKLSTGGTITAAGRGTSTPTYFVNSTGSSWRGPYSGWLWMFRLYGPGGSGKYTTFGQGKAGTHGVPVFQGWGWPNLGNPISLVAAGLKNQSAGVLVWGLRANIPLPVGNIYAFPALVVDGFATGGGKTNPEDKVFFFRLPKDTGLVGLPLVWQLWMADPGAAGGLANTAGLEALIG